MSYILIICHDKFLTSSLAIVTLIAVICVFLFGCLSGLAVVASFVSGCLWMHLLRTRGFEVPNLLFSWKKQEKTLPKVKCRICKRAGCDVHDKLIALYPWKDLKVPLEVDEALEEILNNVLKEYVYTWYKEISFDETFVHELRITFRYVVTSLIRRLRQVNLVTLITGKVTQTVLQHLDYYVRAKRVSTTEANIEKVVLSCYGSDMHVALKNRMTELQYLKQLVENLLLYLLPRRYQTCKSACTLVREIISGSILLKAMDVIADPDIINHVLLLFFDKTPMTIYPEDGYTHVEALEHFISCNAPSNSMMLPLDLQSILKSQDIYNMFAKFLREEGCGHVLNFYQKLDDFNTKILNPDLTKEELKMLHAEAKFIFSKYLDESAPEQVILSGDTAGKIKSVLESGSDNITKLRTSTAFYEAYDEVYNALDKILCPLFLQSDKYFELVCKERVNNGAGENKSKFGHSRKGSGGGSGGDNSSVSKLSNKIKRAFWTTTDDGHVYEEVATELTPEAVFTQEDDAPLTFPESFDKDVYCMDDDPRLKDLSAWRVSIPYVETRVDMNHKYYNVFIIEVQRIDVRDEDRPEDLHWSVERKYHEFYVLEAKLMEFHGELPLNPLPPKRPFGYKKIPFLNTLRATFEKYLQDLLTIPPLRGSELLYKFLKKSNSEFTSGFLPEIKLGRMFKTVPMKLMKEKGQHLDPFLQSFLTSTEPSKPKPSKTEWKEAFESSSAALLRRTQLSFLWLNETIYGDNSSNSSVRMIVGPPGLHPNTLSLYDYCLYLGDSVFNIAPWCSQLLRSVAPLLRQTMQSYVEKFLEVKLRQALVPVRLALLVNLLKDAIFQEKYIPRTDEQKAERAAQMRKEMKEFLPDSLVKFIGKKHHDMGADVIFDFLQHPLLNKQLSYVLLDIAVLELFPELQEETTFEFYDAQNKKNQGSK